MTMPRKPRVIIACGVFLVLTFGLSWMVWWPGMSDRLGLDPVLSGLIGAFGPSLAGLVTVTLFEGRQALGDLLRRLLLWRVSLRWYFFVLLYPAALSLTATLVHVLLGGAWPDFARPPFVSAYPLPPEAGSVPFLLFLLPVFLQQTLVGSSMGEELGWRGYLLPRLQAQPWPRSAPKALVASLLVGAIWGFWHLPLALTPENPMSETPFGWTMLDLMASAVLFTLVYNRTRGSLLLALLFHSAFNMAALFLASSASPGLAAILAWVLPIAVILKTRAALGLAALPATELAQAH
jgi:uncharacterized protein